MKTDSPASARKGKRRGRIAIIDGPDPVDVHVGEKLRQARLLAGLNQQTLGEAVGVSFQAVQKYEKGENRLSASRLHMAAKVLGQPISFFFSDLPEETPPAAPGGFSRDELQLVRHYRSIRHPMVRENLLQMTKRISGLEETEPD